MIFSEKLVRAILRGTKTQARRPVKPGHAEDRYRVGQTHAVQPGRGKPAVARIVLADVQRAPVTSITVADAVAEGFRGVAEFARRWCDLYDPSYRLALEHATDPEVLDRFERRFDDQEVWVLSFRLDHTAAPRLLHRHSERGYTAWPHDAVPGEPEAVDIGVQERFTRQANQRDEERQMAEHDQAREQLAHDLRDARLRIAGAEIRARRRGLDVRDEIRLVTLQMNKVERRIGGAAGSGD